MRSIINTNRTRRVCAAPDQLETALGARVVGQPASVSTIIPFVRMYQASLSPEGRPVGVFLLLGPSGTGKTRTVEALAGVLHGSEKNVVKVDCGEFQMEHEVAKLIGAPPGYLGHRETQPLLTQSRLNSVTSERSSLSIILFDEIEKAAPSMSRLLLGVLDKAVLRLGDNNVVNFDRSLIFLTSNLGAREMIRALQPDFGFQAVTGAGAPEQVEGRLEKIGMQAVKRRFAPEFVNRIDAVVTYRPLDRSALDAILDQQLEDLQQHIMTRLGMRAFFLDVDAGARALLLEFGTSAQFGARELKRTIHRNLMQPLAAMVAASAIEAGAVVQVSVAEDGESLKIEPGAPKRPVRRVA